MKPTDHLIEFVSERQGYSWIDTSSEADVFADARWRLRSGRWLEGDWEHEVVLVKPRTPAAHLSRTSILYITGGSPNLPDVNEARRLADCSNLPVALLFGIPNQPIWGKMEDDLVAHTFEQYLETGDPEWPLLFPMTRAAVRAMDMLEENGFTRFMITGASKRGWTTWLTAATGDARVAGIAPMVIDNLNFPAQMAHQLESWGGYSEQIEDYTSRELQDEMSSQRGAELVQMMDPVHYLDRIRCPILVVNGANDRYWTVDALSLYWDLLPESKRCLIVPNVGHLLGDKRQMIQSVSAFASAAAQGSRLPRVPIGIERKGRNILVSGTLEGPWTAVRLWVARSPSLDFRDSEWHIAQELSACEAATEGFEMEAGAESASEQGASAALVEVQFEGTTGPYSLTAPAVVLPS